MLPLEEQAPCVLMHRQYEVALVIEALSPFVLPEDHKSLQRIGDSAVKIIMQFNDEMTCHSTPVNFVPLF